MNRRISVTLPQKTIALLDLMAPEGDRDRLIDEAVKLRAALKQYVQRAREADVDAQLKEGYIHNAKENLRIAEEWFPLEEEAWQLSQKQEE